MNIFGHIITSLLRLIGKRKQKKRYLSPDKLSPENMAKVMEEVEFLRRQHAVDVRELAPNEIPTIPKRAD
jgi:hypothetical protein